MRVATRYGPFERWRDKPSRTHAICIHTAIHRRVVSTDLREAP